MSGALDEFNSSLGLDSNLNATPASGIGTNGPTPATTNNFTDGTTPTSILDGELSSALQHTGTLYNGKTLFDNTQTGFILGLNATLATPLVQFFIGNTTSYMNWDGTTLTVAGTITASMIQTAVSPLARITINESSNNSLKVYDSSNTVIVVIGPGLSQLINLNQTADHVALSAGNVNNGYTGGAGHTLVGFGVSGAASTANSLELDHNGTGFPLLINNTSLVSSHFKKTLSLVSTVVWVSDGTTPNGNLSGTTGDICLNGDSGQTYICSGTTVWMLAAGIAPASLFGDGSDGNVTISVNTTLSRDMFYNNLTINTAVTLDPNGYRIFVKGTLTFNGSGKIVTPGNAGSGGSSAVGQAGGVTGGSAGAARNSGTLWGGNVGLAGTAGPNFGSGVPSPNVSTAVNGWLYSAGVAGGNGGGSGIALGGTGAAVSGGGVNAGAQIFTNVLDLMVARSLIDVSVGLNIYSIKAAGQNGGAAAGNAGTNNGGGGAGGGGGASGGGGSDAGNQVIFASSIVLSSVSGNQFEAIGGNPGNGGIGGNATGGNSGGGGAGGTGVPGAGGIIMVVTHSVSGGSISASVAAGTTGAAQAGGLPTGVGGPGGNGTAPNGTAGKYTLITV